MMFGVTLLRHDVARAAAQRIASEPRLVRPEVGGEDDPGTFLPERFFVLQDEVRMRAQAVAASAEKRDDKALAESYGLLVQTCVSCHSVYLKPE
ncbi:cytochrome c [Archangium violaceum]|uniref:cytochrome c n=1 Tax=Archangium violaceum TaxID=83451 RepID=UPI001EEFEC06|nr:cytochrome c [Archangium violaceum]